MSRQDERRAQAQLEREWARDRAVRQEASAPAAPPVESPAFCAAAGRNGYAHDFTMKGPDGVRRCWHCVKTRAQVFG